MSAFQVAPHVSLHVSFAKQPFRVFGCFVGERRFKLVHVGSTSGASGFQSCFKCAGRRSKN
eukprot:1728622-Amphidinium_carterae.1